MPRLPLLTLAALVATGALGTDCPAQSVRNESDLSTQAGQSLQAFLRSFDSGLKDRFVAAFADLNDDGRQEAIVYLTSSDWCGSGGCTTLILTREGDSWRLLTEVTVTRPPIRALALKSNGWRSIGVWVQGGGVQPGFEAELRFDGKTYPQNPTTPPARPLAERAEGETLIASPPGR
jgi:hypothetical protein